MLQTAERPKRARLIFFGNEAVVFTVERPQNVEQHLGMTPEECLIEYGRAWFETDHERRVEVLRRCCTEDIVFMDPQRGQLHGLQAVSTMIGDSLGSMSQGAQETKSAGSERGRTGSGVGVEVVTPIDVRHGFFRYSFVWTLPDGSKHGGTDFCELAEDGRMKLITVWPATPDFPVSGADPAR